MLMVNVKLVVLIFLVAKKKRVRTDSLEKRLSAPVAFLPSVAPLALWQPLHQSFFRIKSFVY